MSITVRMLMTQDSMSGPVLAETIGMPYQNLARRLRCEANWSVGDLSALRRTFGARLDVNAILDGARPVGAHLS